MSEGPARSGPAITTKRFDELSPLELHDILRLRSDVFVVEQNCVYPDLDGRDIEPRTLHHWLARSGTVIAYARQLSEPDGSIRIGRVVTDRHHRGEGLAAAMVTHICRHSSGVLVLDAQTYLVDWYRKLGFSVTGSEFLEDGIPHTPMSRSDA